MTAAERTIRQRRTTTLPCARPAPSRRRTRSSRSRPSPACATAATMSARSARRAGTASCRACSAEILATFRARVRALIRRLFAGTEPQPPEPALWDDVRRRARWVAALDADRDARLQALAARFLRDKAITPVGDLRSEEHTSELQSLMRISYAGFCLKKKTQKQHASRHQP